MAPRPGADASFANEDILVVVYSCVFGVKRWKLVTALSDGRCREIRGLSERCADGQMTSSTRVEDRRDATLL